MKHKTNQRFWENASRRVCRRVNAGFCFQRFLPIFLGLSIAQGCFLLLLRRFDTSQFLLWTGYGVAVVLAMGLSAWWSRKRFFSIADGLVHLETRLSLHNRLTAARQGHATWPAPRRLPDSLRWSWQHLMLPPAGAAGFLLLAGWIPVEREAATPVSSPEEPLSWQEIESWAEILEERELFEEETLSQWREQVQQMRDQEAQEWYSHASLEAGDHLRDTAAESIRRLQSALEKAAYPLSLARDSLNEIPLGLQPLLQEHWLDALSQLSNGDLKLSKEALAQLAEVDFSNLEGLSQDQIARLARMLTEGLSACAASLGHCEGDGDGICSICGGLAAAGFCSGGGPGSGGIGKGPGPADLTFAESPSLIDSQRREAVSNPDLSRAALGQQIGATQAEPEVDADAQQQITAGGGAVLSGAGGDAVFHSRLTPAERRRIQNYFE